MLNSAKQNVRPKQSITAISSTGSGCVNGRTTRSFDAILNRKRVVPPLFTDTLTTPPKGSPEAVMSDALISGKLNESSVPVS